MRFLLNQLFVKVFGLFLIGVLCLASCTIAEQEAAVIGNWQSSTGMSDTDTVKTINIWKLDKDLDAREGTFTRKLYVPGFHARMGVEQGENVDIVVDIAAETSGKWYIANGNLNMQQDVKSVKFNTANIHFKYGDMTLATLADIAQLVNASVPDLKKELEDELRKEAVDYLNREGATLHYKIGNLYNNELVLTYNDADCIWKRLK